MGCGCAREGGRCAVGGFFETPSTRAAGDSTRRPGGRSSLQDVRAAGAGASKVVRRGRERRPGPKEGPRAAGKLRGDVGRPVPSARSEAGEKAAAGLGRRDCDRERADSIELNSRRSRLP